jgi:hypothetical protein
VLRFVVMRMFKFDVSSKLYERCHKKYNFSYILTFNVREHLNLISLIFCGTGIPNINNFTDLRATYSESLEVNCIKALKFFKV